MQESGKLHTSAAVITSTRLGGPLILFGQTEAKNNLCRQTNPRFPYINHENDGATQAIITLFLILDYDSHKFEKLFYVKTR